MPSKRRNKPPVYFTPEQANRMLPLVRAIVGDIVELATDLNDRRQRWEKALPGRPHAATPAHDEEFIGVQQEWARDAARLEEYLDELHRLGVQLKGWDGLVDFPSWMDDREVCLCWKLGESEVMYWHEIDAGFAGRQPLIVESPPDAERCTAPAPR